MAGKERLQRFRRGAVATMHVVVTVALVALAAVPTAIIQGSAQAQPAMPDRVAEAAPANPPPANAEAPAYDLWSPQAQGCQDNARYLGLAILQYASQHSWRLPPDLGATLPYMQDYDPRTQEFVPVPPAQAAQHYLCPQDQARLAVPAVPTPEWVNQNTSYAYLGGADVNVDALTPEQLDSAVFVHEKSNTAHPDMNGHPIGFSLGGSLGPQTAERIAWSRQVLDGARGAAANEQGSATLARMWASVQAAPKASECARNQAEISKALAIYMNFSRGHYPPTLGDTLPYVLKHMKRTDPLTHQSVAFTAQEAARLYLCPLEQDIEIPKEVTPEWINEHTSFVYLGDETLTEDANPQAVVFYEKLDVGHGDAVNLAYADCHVQALPKDRAQALIDRSIVMLEADRARMAEQAAAKGSDDAATGTSGTGGSAPARSGRSRGPADPKAARIESLRRLMQVLVDDTQCRKERLPEDLVDVCTFATQARGPKAPPPLSPQVAARLLLSPRALQDLKVPAKPTKQWLEEKMSYAYLGDDRLTVGLMQAAIPAAKWSETVLVHEKPVEGDPWVAVATLDLTCRLVEEGKAKELIEESRPTLAMARTPSSTVALTGAASRPAGSAKHSAGRWREGKVERMAGPASQASDSKSKAKAE